MNRIYFVALLLAFSACNCPGTSVVKGAGPELTVVTPDRVGDECLLDFGQVHAGETYTKSILLENSGRGGLSLESAQLRDGTSPSFTLGGARAPNVLDPGQQFMLIVTYAPTAVESAAGFVDIVSNDGTHPQLAVRLAAEAVSGKIEVCVPGATVVCRSQVAPKNLAIDFGLLTIGSMAKQQLQVSNIGTVDLTLATVSLRASSEFRMVGAPATAQILPPGGSLSFEVEYTPVDGGSDLGSLELSSDDPSARIVSVDLKGAGDGPKLCPSPMRLDFGPVEVNSLAQKPVTLTNCGSKPLNVSSTSLNPSSSARFSILSGGAAATLSPGASQDVVIRYAPKVLGPDTGRLDLASDGGNGSIPINGSGSPPSTCMMDASPQLVDFGNVANGTSSDRTVTVSNKGLKACNWTGLSGPTGSPDFSRISSPPMPVVLAPGASRDVVFRFTPASATASATASLTSDDPVNPSLTITLQGSGVTPPPCQIVVTPQGLNFGGLVPGDRSIRSVALSNTGTAPCRVSSATLASGNPSFVVGSGNLPVNVFPGGGIFGNPQLGVTYAPTAAGSDADTLIVTYFETDGFFPTPKGPIMNLAIQLSGLAGARRLCVVPPRLHFGQVSVGATKDLSFTLTACSSASVTVSAVTVEPAGTPFSLLPGPALPSLLASSANQTQTVRFTPSAASPSAARIHIVSDDPVFPDQYVDVDGGPEIVPPQAAELMYSWTASTSFGGGSMNGTVYRSNMQGPPQRTPFYGSANSQPCSGCHAVSPDGRYVALLEYMGAGFDPLNPSSVSTMKIVDARTGGSVPVPGTSDALFPSWRPNVNTNPPYQFVFSSSNKLKIASVATGILGDVAGATVAGKVQTQPSWGPNGKIVYVVGNPDPNAKAFEIVGPCDLMTIPEGGGTPTPVAGASGNGGGNYYPEFSPNGKYLAYTFSAAGQTSKSAPDSVVKLVDFTTGQIFDLPQLNAAGPNSWATWSRDGMFLSFSSTRPGSLSADVYFATVNQNTGGDGPAQAMTLVNTPDFDHIARWSPLPPP